MKGVRFFSLPFKKKNLTYVWDSHSWLVFSNTIICNALIFSIVFRLRFTRPPGMPRALWLDWASANWHKKNYVMNCLIFYLPFYVVTIAVVVVVFLLYYPLHVKPWFFLMMLYYNFDNITKVVVHHATVWTLKEAFNSCVLPFQTKVLNLHLPMLLWTLPIVDVLVPNGFVS